VPRESFSCAYQRHHECNMETCSCPCHDDERDEPEPLTPDVLTRELRAERERLRAVVGVGDYVLDLMTWACEYIDGNERRG